MKIGFSTGALSRGDFSRALTMLEGKGADAIELSALRVNELDPLLKALGDLRLGAFDYISIHAPSQLEGRSEQEIATLLMENVPSDWSIVVHPDTLEDLSAWEPFDDRLCIENMDKSKPTGRTTRELVPLFERLPHASMCLDLAHARQFDPTMSLAAELIAMFGDRIRQIHISDISGDGRHLPLSSAAVYAYQEIASLLPHPIPVIIESVIREDRIEHEIELARRSLTTPASVGVV